MSIREKTPFLARLGDLGRQEIQPAETAPERVLTDTQIDSWEREGFLILKGFIGPAEIQRVAAVIQDQWDNRVGNDHEVDVLTGTHGGRAYKLFDTPDSVRDEAYKLNNLFLRISAIRQVALLPRLKQAFTELLRGEPMICNSLNFERGSQQPYHIDSWYMPPPVDNAMVAASISLDAVDNTNGPIAFIPRSHSIPAYRFSDGRLNEKPEEAHLCRAYLDREIALRGLSEVEFCGDPGDVFVWHSQLLHAGKPILDMSRTRKSMVVHYWRVQDLAPDQLKSDPLAGYYLGHTLRGEISV